MKTDHLLLLKKFKKKKILVAGDFILDAYFQGTCTRLAPEAPVPVVDLTAKVYCLGGAANTAANLSGLGANVFFCTVMGNDQPHDQAIRLLKEAGVSTDLLVADPGRTTIVKTRVTAPSHTLLRYDEGTDTTLTTVSETELIHNLHKTYFECDAVLVADYDKGILTPTVISELKKLKLMEDKFIAVDSKRAEVFAQIGPSLIKPNYDEAIKLLSLPYARASRAEQLMPYGIHFYTKTNAALIAATIDQDGSLFFKNGEFVHRQCATIVKDPNVSGAGDTFISALLLSLVCGAAVPVAAELAGAAAAIAIAKKDTAVCLGAELANLFAEGDKTLNMASQLKQKCKELQLQGKRIVFTNGCFDILHSGHVNYLQQARQLGDVLIVGLNNDDSIKRLKGRERPINSLDNRIEVLSALECIDYIVPFGSLRDDTPVNLIKVIHPDVFVKGGDYQDKQLPEAKLLKKIGCKMVFVPLVRNQSTTRIIDKVQGNGHLKIALVN